MKKLITLLLLVPFSLLTLAGCGEEEKVARDTTEKTQAKEVEVFDLTKERAVLTFTKSGSATSENTVYVSPETSAKITEIKVEIGDEVEKGDTLIILGDSASTDIADIQYSTALETLDLTQESEYLTGLSADKSVELANLAFKTAEQSYTNAVLSRSSAEAIYKENLDSAEISLDTAEEAYKTAKKTYYDIVDMVEDLEDDIDDLEDDIDDLDDDDPSLSSLEATLAQLESSLASAETQEESARFNMISAKNGIDQAEIGVALTKESYYAQIDQIDQSIELAYLQYESAARQLEQATIAAGLQDIGSEIQTVQAESGVQTARINKDLKYIKAPIDGVVTSISAEEGNFSSPGQALVKIENPLALSITTSVNQYEVTLIKQGDVVMIEGDSGTEIGEITSISPTANEISKKIEVEISTTSNGKILAGSFVKLHFSSTAKGKLFIPLNSISGIEGDKKVVKTVNENNEIEYKNIETGEIVGDYIEVLSGLDGDEKLIKATTAFIEEGEKVEIK